MQEVKDSRMGTEYIPKLMFSLAMPAIIAQVINILYNIVDRMYIGHIPEVGALALTGLGVSAPLLIIISGFSMLVGGGGAPLAAIAMGKNDKEEAERILGAGTYLLTILGIVLTILIFIFKEPILYIFGASDVTFSYANSYTSIYLLGTIFVQYALGLNTFITSQGQSKIAMFSVLIGAGTNIILDPIFIFGFGMGVQGAAWATVISQALSGFYVIYFLRSKRSVIRIKKEYVHFDKLILKKTIALGVSPFIMAVTQSAVVIVFNSGLLRYGGDLHVGAMTIMQSVMQLMIVPVQGFTQGVQPIVSYNFGAQKMDRVKETVKKSLLLTVATTVIFYGVILLVPQLFARIFTTDPELTNVIIDLLPIFMGGMWMFGVQMTAQMFFVGTGEAKKSLFLALLRKVIVLIPLALILPNWFEVRGIYYSEPIADIISATTAGILLWATAKKTLSAENIALQSSKEFS